MISQTIKISVITITYNSERTLEDTIKSVISQDYDNLEYLIIDGGSKDHTLDIVQKYRDKIAVVVSEPDNGISDAFNKGIRLASGEVIGIINSDDLLLPGALKAVAKAYEESVDVYRGRTIRWNDVTDVKTRSIPSMRFPANSIKKRPICHQSTFVTKRAYEKYGVFDVNLKYMMDKDLLIRLYEAGIGWKYVDADLAVSRSGGVTDRDNFWQKRKEAYAVIKNNNGGTFLAYSNELRFLVRHSIKSIFSIFGIERVRKIIYRKQLIK